MSEDQTARRKAEHLRIVIEEDVQHRGGALLDDVRLLHQALPELALDEIDTGARLFGKRLAAPLMVTSMTGGAERTGALNRELAAVAARAGIAFAVGSQRPMLERRARASDFAVRAAIPNGVLLGNLGGAQVAEVPLAEVVRLVREIEADGLCVHLNPAQELVQPEGNRSFRGQLDGIARLCEALDGRVLVKETGAGLAPETLARLRSVGVCAVDVAGSGGTSWTRVELLRAPAGPLQRLGQALADWGVPTAVSTIAARRILGAEATVVASGGITSGLDCARAIAAGASLCGFARAILMAWHRGGSEGASAFVEALISELRAAMLLTGARTVAELGAVPRVYTGALREWLAGLGYLP
jgi:isopentenyl-diphosphate delta-isomerase